MEVEDVLMNDKPNTRTRSDVPPPHINRCAPPKTGATLKDVGGTIDVPPSRTLQLTPYICTTKDGMH